MSKRTFQKYSYWLLTLIVVIAQLGGLQVFAAVVSAEPEFKLSIENQDVQTETEFSIDVTGSKEELAAFQLEKEDALKETKIETIDATHSKVFLKAEKAGIYELTGLAGEKRTNTLQITAADPAVKEEGSQEETSDSKDIPQQEEPKDNLQPIDKVPPLSLMEASDGQSTAAEPTNKQSSTSSMDVTVTYPAGQNHIVATLDWVTQNLRLNLTNIVAGQAITLQMGDDKWDYSRVPFDVGIFKVIPKDGGTFLLVPQESAPSATIDLNLKFRYRENIAPEQEDVEFLVTLKQQDEEINVPQKVLVKKYKENVREDEIIKKVTYGVTKDGNVAWGYYYNYNGFNLRGNDNADFVFKDIVDKGQKIITNSISVYDVPQPLLENRERNFEHGDYNYSMSVLFQSMVEGDKIDHETNSANPFGLADLRSSFYIYLETKPEQSDVSEEVTNKVNVQIAGEGGQTQKDDSKASFVLPPSGSGDNLINVSVTKRWEDGDNQDGKRPAHIHVQLLADGAALGGPVELNADNNWSYTWNDMSERLQGKKVDYTVEEITNVDGYTATIDDNDKENMIITNSYTPETTTISGQKTWDDDEDQDDIRPSEIKVHLLADGVQLSDRTLTVTAENNWSYKWEGLPKNKDGKPINYTIEEEPVPGYASEVVNGYDLVNHHAPDLISLRGVKTWDDDNNRDGKRPSSITVRLFADGKELTDKAQVVSPDGTHGGEWSYSWKDLDKNKDGRPIEYKVEEDQVPGYTTKTDGLNLTNSYTPETVDISGTKTWDDNGNEDGIRPESITLHLLANGEQLADKTITVRPNAKGDWQYGWKNLPKNKDGSPIEYTVKEEIVPGYKSEQTGYDLKNTHVIKKGGFNLYKKAEDTNKALAGSEFRVAFSKEDAENEIFVATDGKAYKKDAVLPSGVHFVVSTSDAEGSARFDDLRLDWFTDSNGNGLQDSDIESEATFPDDQIKKSYWVVETKAPNGYELLREPKEVIVTLTSGTTKEPELTITNKPKTALPFTGGTGNLLLIILALGAGLIGMLAIAGASFANNKHSGV